MQLKFCELTWLPFLVYAAVEISWANALLWSTSQTSTHRQAVSHVELLDRNLLTTNSIQDSWAAGVVEVVGSMLEQSICV